MSIGSLGGVIGSAAGAPLSQTSGSETERAKESASQSRQVDANEKAERAAGIGQTEQDQESSERDADGRRFWETPAKPGESQGEQNESSKAGAASRQSKDATGNSGTKLDLTG
jgi:hypothetical protein